MEEAPCVLTQVRVEEPERVFKVAALGLEVVRAEVHPFRPDDAREELHRGKSPRYKVQGSSGRWPCWVERLRGGSLRLSLNRCDAADARRILLKNLEAWTDYSVECDLW